MPCVHLFYHASALPTDRENMLSGVGPSLSSKIQDLQTTAVAYPLDMRSETSLEIRRLIFMVRCLFPSVYIMQSLIQSSYSSLRAFEQVRYSLVSSKFCISDVQ